MKTLAWSLVVFAVVCDILCVLGAFGTVSTVKTSVADRESEVLAFEPPGSLRITSARVGRDTPVRVRVRNNSSEVIRIEKLVASCECTSVKADASTIEAGSYGEISGFVKAKVSQADARVWLQFDAVGRNSRRHFSYPIEIRYTSTVSIEVEMNDLPVESVKGFETGYLKIANLTDETVNLSVSVSGIKGMSLNATRHVIEPRGSVRSTIFCSDLEERDGVILVSVEGAETDKVDLQMRRKGRVTCTPRVLVLGSLRRNGVSVEASRPVQLTLSGELLANAELRVVEAPRWLSPPRIVLSGSVSDCTFSIVDRPGETYEMSAIRFEIRSKSGHLLQTISVPVVGLVDGL